MSTDAGERIVVLKDRAIRTDGDFVVYWMTMARRLRYNFGLQRAVDLAVETKRPLVILEALRVDYEHASDRLHGFVLDGMAEHLAAVRGTRVVYHPYVEPTPGAGRGLLKALAADAVAVVTDWYPAFFIPHMLAAAARQIDARLEAVDSNGILPVLAGGRAFPTAYSFRAYLQRTLREQLRSWPEVDPLRRLPRATRARLPSSIRQRWPAATVATLKGRGLGKLPIDHRVPRVPIEGGNTAARARLAAFVRSGLARYESDHNQPASDATSRLSPWLHFGHLGVHEVFDAVMKHERWSPGRLPPRSRGARDGWWQVSRGAEAFLDELVVWRELAFNTSAYVPGFDRVPTLPAWAQRTLRTHRRDRREHRYSLDTFDRAATHDPLWNAVQRQLVRDGWFHGYMRMLWGKKILEWSATPEQALATMEQLMNRYSLDGRDPNSWAGFMWVLGRYDRPWPEREIFGQVRYMSSQSTARKLRVKPYLERYAK